MLFQILVKQYFWHQQTSRVGIGFEFHLMLHAVYVFLAMVDRPVYEDRRAIISSAMQLVMSDFMRYGETPPHRHMPCINDNSFLFHCQKAGILVL